MAKSGTVRSQLDTVIGHTGSKRVSTTRCHSISDRFNLGVDKKRIAEYFKMPTSTVSNVIKRMETATVRKRQGRPPKLDEQLLKKLEEFVNANRFLPLDKIASQFSAINEVNICKRTLSRYIKKLGIKSFKAAEKPFLREKNILKRTLWGIMHISFDLHKWSNVLFTDESTFNVRPIKYNVRCLRKEGKRLEFDCMRPTFTSGRKSVNVWGGFCYHGRLPLVRIYGTFNNKKYREILDQHVFPYATTTWGHISNFTLQEDNCGPHKSKAIKNYLDEKMVHRMFWPAQPPDLNPIEMFWDL